MWCDAVTETIQLIFPLIKMKFLCYFNKSQFTSLDKMKLNKIPLKINYSIKHTLHMLVSIINISILLRTKVIILYSWKLISKNKNNNKTL